MSQELFDVGTSRSEVLVRLCSWCKRMQHGTAWVELQAEAVQAQIFERPEPPRVTHGICGDCARRMLNGIGRGE